MNINHPEDENSFNLNTQNRQRVFGKKFTWQEHAYERLKVLYGVGKILSTIDPIEKTFPEILALCFQTFPFASAIVIENRSGEIQTIVWNSKIATPAQIDSAINNAKETFIFLTDASLQSAQNLRSTNVFSVQLDTDHSEKKAPGATKNYCTIPLLVDHLPAFGILQLEGSLRLNVKDVEFISALADLIAISIDHQYKTQLEKATSSSKLSQSESHIEDLEAEREMRERFVNLLTHDLRTPLSAIKMCSQLIDRQAEDSKAVRSYVHRINKSVNRADQMISNLLDANRIRSGEKLPLKIEIVDLVDLVKKTLDELTLIHGNRFFLKAETTIVGQWDPRGIQRILENLCINAIKYGSSEDKISVTLKIKEANAIIEVQNFGNIISEEDQKYLFQQFRRGPKKTIIKGWGIGLALVRGVAEAHGGTVKVSSDVETGTNFTVLLPMSSLNV